MEKSASKLLDKNNRYSASKSAKDILSDLLSLKQMDAEVESKPNPYSKPLIVAIIFGVLAVYVTLFAADGEIIGGTTVFFVVVTSFAGILFLYYKYKSIENLNIENVRFECCLSLLELLSEDISSKEKINVKIQFGDIDNPQFLVKRSKINRNFIVEEKFYSANWLELSGRFVDKTKFKLQCKINQRTRVKRNIRGKIKYKTKPKGNSVVLTVYPDTSKGSRLSDLSDTKQEDLNLVNGYFSLKRLTVDDEKIVIGVKIDNVLRHVEPYDGQSVEALNSNTSAIIMSLFLSAFNLVNLNKKLTNQLSH